MPSETRANSDRFLLVHMITSVWRKITDRAHQLRRSSHYSYVFQGCWRNVIIKKSPSGSCAESSAVGSEQPPERRRRDCRGSDEVSSQ